MPAKYWLSPPPEKDDFGKPITEIFIDGKTKLGPRGFMTPDSYKEYGIGLGPGWGQKYQKQPDKRWLKVEG